MVKKKILNKILLKDVMLIWKKIIFQEIENGMITKLRKLFKFKILGFCAHLLFKLGTCSFLCTFQNKEEKNFADFQDF